MAQTKNNSQNNIRQVVGLHAALEVLRVRPNKVTEIWVKQGAERSQDHSAFIEFANKNKSKVKFHIKPEAALDKIASSHQGVCLFVSETPELELDDLSQEQHEKIILIALDEVTDPHNVGAVLRTAWLLGAKAVHVPELRAAHLTAAVMKVASGAAEHIPLVTVKNLPDTVTYLKDKGFWSYGLAAEGKQTLWKTQFPEKVVLVTGSEDKGLRRTTANVCDELVSIPQTNAQASLNASVATALALYEVVRQHKNL